MPASVLASAGVSLDQSGNLQIDDARLKSAIAADTAQEQAGNSALPGASGGGKSLFDLMA